MEIKLDEQKLNELVEQYSIQGAEKAIKEFYTGYNSPFMKHVQDELNKVKTSLFFKLPELTVAINNAVNNKITEMANAVVANTFIPMLNRMLSDEIGRKSTITTQDLFEHFGDAMKETMLSDDFDADELDLIVEDRFPGVFDHKKLLFKYKNDTKFELDLMECSEPNKDEQGNKLYKITTLPGCSQFVTSDLAKPRQMRIRLKDGATLEMPFTPDVLRDEFMRYVAGILLCNTPVVIKNYHEYINEEEE